MQKELNTRILEQFKPTDCRRVSNLLQIISLKNRYRENLSKEILEDTLELPYSRDPELSPTFILLILSIALFIISLDKDAALDPLYLRIVGSLLFLLFIKVSYVVDKNKRKYVAFYEENYYERAFELAQNYRAYWEAWKENGCTAHTIKADGMEVVLAQNIFDNIEKELS